MTQDILAIYDHGVFRPLQPIALPEGTRVHLSIGQESGTVESVNRVWSPRLADPTQIADFEMEIGEG